MNQILRKYLESICFCFSFFVLVMFSFKFLVMEACTCGCFFIDFMLVGGFLKGKWYRYARKGGGYTVIFYFTPSNKVLNKYLYQMVNAYILD